MKSDTSRASSRPDKPGLAFGFGQAAHRIDVVRLDAIEVAFRLPINGAEDSIGIGLSVNMRDTPIVGPQCWRDLFSPVLSMD